MPATARRDYPSLTRTLTVGRALRREARMQFVVDTLWPALSPAGVSWLGFYLDTTDDSRGREMILGPRRDKPACSPIGLHGACGRCLLSRRPLIVTDVANLGAGYIACDPRDRSEVVIPLLESDGTCWGVFDVDSHDVGAFAESDALGLHTVLAAAELTTPDPPHSIERV